MMSEKDLGYYNMNKQRNEKEYVLISEVNQYDPIWDDELYTGDELKSRQIRNHFHTATFLYFNLGQPLKHNLHHPFATLDAMSLNPKILALSNYPQIDNAEFYFTKKQVKQIKKAFKVNNEHNSNMANTGGLPYDNNGINFAHNIDVFYNTNPIAVPAKLVDKIPLQAIRDISISQSGVYDGLAGGAIGILDMLPDDIKLDKKLLKDVKNNYNVFRFNDAFVNQNVMHYVLTHWSGGKRIYKELKNDVKKHGSEYASMGKTDSNSDLECDLSISIDDDQLGYDSEMDYEASPIHNHDRFVKHMYHKLWKNHNPKYYTARLDLKKHLKELKPYVIKGIQADLRSEQKALNDYYKINVPTKKRYEKYSKVYDQKFLKAVAKTHLSNIGLNTQYILITDAHIPSTNHKKHQFEVIQGYKDGQLITKHVPLSNHKELAQQLSFTLGKIADLRQDMYASNKHDYRHVTFVAVPVKELNLITPKRLKFILRDESNRIVFNFVESDEIPVKEWMQKYSMPFTLYQVYRNYIELHEDITTSDLDNLPNADEFKYDYDNA